MQNGSLNVVAFHHSEERIRLGRTQLKGSNSWNTKTLMWAKILLPYKAWKLLFNT